MTVGELFLELSNLIEIGHADTRVIANCDFILDDVHYEKPFLYLNNVYYQSGDIELGFSDREEE